MKFNFWLLRKRVDTKTGDQFWSEIQKLYIDNIHDTYTYIHACISYIVSLFKKTPVCTMSSVPRITAHKTFHCIYKVVVEPPMRKLCLKPPPACFKDVWKASERLPERPLKNYHTYSMTVILLLVEEILHQFIGSVSHYLPHFIHPRWCRISSINSTSYYPNTSLEVILTWLFAGQMFHL